MTVSRTSTGARDAPPGAAFPTEAILGRYELAKARRAAWDDHWRECYRYAMPRREGSLSGDTEGAKKTDDLFDGTAPDAVEQLAASLMAELTPPWSRWFDIVPGPDTPPERAAEMAGPLEEISATIQGHFDRSNIAVEIHQCFLDLVTVGTASLLFEEAAIGETSAFRFAAVPMGDAVLEEGPSGVLDVSFRKTQFTREALLNRFPNATVSDEIAVGETDWGEKKFAVLEAVLPDAKRGYAYRALLTEGDGLDVEATELAAGTYEASPFINFRWMKAPGEGYGRSPVMKTLPDIKTANKVVELILKNATIAVTGIWQADDDGVLNPATVKLLPGTIIPKAVGSTGLTPLQAPGNFDLSNLVLEQLRARVRSGLLADRLGQVDGPKMTATEVLERSSEMARQLGATYGRLQAELLLPLARRALAILRRRGEIPDILIDGRDIDLRVVSPIALHRRRAEAQTAMQWFDSVQVFGPEAASIIKPREAARWLAKAFRVPDTLLRTEREVEEAAAKSDPGLEAAPAVNPLAALAGQLGAGMAETTGRPSGQVDPTAGMSALAPAAATTPVPTVGETGNG
jgi:hypothetical protein